MREFMGRELPGEDGAGGVQLSDGRRVGGGDCVTADSRMASRADPRRRVNVLQSKRDAMHRATGIARHDLSLGVECLIERSLKDWQQVCVELWVERLRSTDQCGRQLHWRKLPPLYQPSRFGDCQKGEFIGHITHSAFVLRRSSLDYWSRASTRKLRCRRSVGVSLSVSNRCFIGAGLRVRIRLPPPVSQANLKAGLEFACYTSEGYDISRPGPR